MTDTGSLTRQKRRWQDVHGLLLLDKPSGMTSNQALQKARRMLNAAKGGHTGSLDPMATGLLPCCFGDATRIAHFMLASDKTYEASLRLGWETDTGDATGQETRRLPVFAISDEAILAACRQFSGQIEQIPPMYSALHHQGKRLYEWAREGVHVERPPRMITVHCFEYLGRQGDVLNFRMTVSKGTYIRTLLEDVAKALGTYGHLTALRRTQVSILQGPMVTLDELKGAAAPVNYLLPLDYALQEYPELTLTADQAQALIHGQRIQRSEPAGIYRLYDAQSVFLGLGEILVNGQTRVKKLFLKSYAAGRQRA